MKRLSLFILAAIVLLNSCKNEGGKIVKTNHRDSSLTLAAYLGYQLRGITYGIARKITIDTLTWVGKDSATMKKEWTKIVYYEVECPIPVKDSISAKAVGIKWNGKDTVVNRLLQADAKYVRDGIVNWDSASAYLKQFMDTTRAKIDSSTIKK